MKEQRTRIQRLPGGPRLPGGADRVFDYTYEVGQNATYIPRMSECF